MYPFNYPFAKFIGTLGIPLSIKIVAFFDKEAGVYVAYSPTIKGLNVEAETLDELRKEVMLTLPDLLKYNEGMTKEEINHQNAHLSFCTPLNA